ncbi:glycosyltransferase family 4 protein [Seonamhaeicola algicola]|uniref:Glycosyltransferase family 4 protein n=1 Tax=Seonamhaeicola algicola TaxID=1719036 RepID=A0A5C7AY25_9FLAO|nr:glycosyltransferase [Seonamhaeicola algicola]TXE13004.1 glycosyltransferase family 4 protein [Seonamhaeicola algicola]
MRKIKVAHVLNSVGGVDVYLRLISENTNPNRIEHIIIHQRDLKKKPYKNGNSTIREYYIPIKRNIHLFNDIKAIYKTIKYLKKEKPDVIHAHSAKGGIIARSASLFYKLNVLYTPHAFSYLSATSKIKKNIFLRIEKLFKYFNSYVLATSQSEKNRALNDVCYSESKVIVFNNCILPIETKDLHSNVLKEHNLPCNYLATVGRPSYQKNIEFMLDVIFELKKNIPDIHLVVMGVGEYSPNLNAVKAKVDHLELKKNITLVNWINRESIFSIVNKSMLYISTSRYEGLPYSVIESLALSKACVVSDCDGNRDLVENNYNGYVIKQGDLESFTKKIEKLYFDHKIRNKFANNSYNLFNNKFNLRNNITCLEEVYFKHSK